VAKTFYPPGTEVRLATPTEAQCVFPGIKVRSGSAQAAVWLPELAHPTIVSHKELQ
jgi:hypothetical protein